WHAAVHWPRECVPVPRLDAAAPRGRVPVPAAAREPAPVPPLLVPPASVVRPSWLAPSLDASAVPRALEPAAAGRLSRPFAVSYSSVAPHAAVLLRLSPAA